MNTASAIHVLSWAQTEVEGLRAAPLDLLRPGATWRWTGAATRVDRPDRVLRLEGAAAPAELRLRAARRVGRLTGLPPPAAARLEPAAADTLRPGFVVTDGYQSFLLRFVITPGRAAPLVVASEGLPPVDRDLWVVHAAACIAGGEAQGEAGGLICFARDTAIAVPGGQRLIQEIRPGDLILTRDNGPQPVLWAGSRRLGGGRLHAMPHLRPIRFRAGALGVGRPDADLLVSPRHRMLVTGAAAQALFNAPEVLVAAEDLLNGRTIRIDHALGAVEYFHLLLEAHNIIQANGLASESFHPAEARLDALEPAARASLTRLMPEIALEPQTYGAPARRPLSAAEAAILRHAMAA